MFFERFKLIFGVVALINFYFDAMEAVPLPAQHQTSISTISTATPSSLASQHSSTLLSAAKFNLKWTPRTAWHAASAHHITPINSAVNIAGGIDGVGGVGGGGSTSKAASGVPYVIIHHTATKACESTTACRATMRSMQRTHQLDNGWDDIGYNFVIGGTGTKIEIYEGRGFNIKGAHAGANFNGRSIGIALIGDWTDTLPPLTMLEKLKELISNGVEAGYIRNDYKLLGHRQVKATACPGTKLFNELKRWPHFTELSERI